MSESAFPAQSSYPCPFCEGSLRTRIVKQELPLTTPKGQVTLSVDVPYEFCEACGHEGFGEAGERARTEAIYTHLGRVTPWEIVKIRERLGLTQAAFADWLGVGRASLERWECGAVMQNKSMDNLIVLLSDPVNKAKLDTYRVDALRVVTLGKKVIDLSRFKALQGCNETELLTRMNAFQLRMPVHV